MKRYLAIRKAVVEKMYTAQKKQFPQPALECCSFA